MDSRTGHLPSHLTRLTAGCIALMLLAGGAAAQTSRTGLEIGGVPAVNFDSDEGFGYGAIAELYEYGAGDLAPYVWTVQPTVFLTTEGRRDVTLFFDAPHLLPGRWRLDVYLGVEKHVATPFYGFGNDTERSSTEPNLFYRFARTRNSALFNLQRHVAESPLRVLFGGGIARTTVNPYARDATDSRFAIDVSSSEEQIWTNHVRGGLVWDTRDRQTAPRRGAWTELLVQWIDEGIGADVAFIRWTVTDRRYVSFGDRVVFANRLLFQGVGPDAPAHELFVVQTSFKQQEGLGGAKTVRGIFKNRFTGRGTFLWNAELRWRASDFELWGRPFHTVVSGFLDQGRVWAGPVRLSESLQDLHRGYGAGVRLGMGENFTVAADLGRSTEAGTQVYIALGYLY